MQNNHLLITFVAVSAINTFSAFAQTPRQTAIGQEVAIPGHLKDGEEFLVPVRRLVKHGQALFSANWTTDEGGGRPLSKGNDKPLADPSHPLVFPRNFNRVSGPDANSCAGCHNAPFGIAGGGGDIVANVFVLGQRMDFATFDQTDTVPTRNAVDERGVPFTLQNVANSRATLGMFGAGFIEMLARQITEDLQRIRTGTLPGQASELSSKGISFGTINHRADGTWDVSQVEGMPAMSLVTSGATPPSLIIRPFHQAGRVISIREFTNNAFNHHHGIQSTERFGVNTDPDGDGFVNEMTRADVTAAAVFQATMAVPGRVIPNDPAIESAVHAGEALFKQLNCTSCHIPNLPLDREGWIYTEPNPFNVATNLRPGDAPTLSVDLTSPLLPLPRLRQNANGTVKVPAFTDFKLHDICADASDPNIEPLDMLQPAGSPGFFAGNRKFITRKLWGVANEPPYFHHGLYTTMRQAVLAHAGEALAQRQAFQALSSGEQDAVIEFLKTLQILPPGTPSRVVDEHFLAKTWANNF